MKILIIGEVMLDLYYLGDIEKISPEAPVPIFKLNKQNKLLGGSANIAQHIKNIDENINVDIFSFENEMIKDLLSQNNINYYYFSAINNIVKVRWICKNQQVFRMDVEDNKEYNIESVLLYLKKINLNNYDLIILSDYNKGLFNSEIIDYIFNNSNKPIFSDMKPNNMGLVNNSLFIKSNFKELKEFLNNDIENTNISIEDNLNNIKKHFNRFILTRSEQGISFINNDIKHFKNKEETVFDVTGAGDLVTASFCVEYLKTKDIDKSIEITLKRVSELIKTQRGLE